MKNLVNLVLSLMTGILLSGLARAEESSEQNVWQAQRREETKKIERRDPNRVVSYIDQSLVEKMIQAVTEIDHSRLTGTWRLVLVGPTSNNPVGFYDSAGIPDKETRNIPTLTISSTATSWLPQSVATQIVLTSSEDIVVYINALIKKGESVPVSLEGKYFVVQRKDKQMKCGFVNSNFDHLLCIFTGMSSDEPKVVGYERI